MGSDSWQNGFKMASEDNKKYIKKVLKTLNGPQSMADSKALTIQPTLFFRTFLRFWHKTPLKRNKLDYIYQMKLDIYSLIYSFFRGVLCQNQKKCPKK